MAPFREKRRKLGPVLLAYESGYLSVESGGVMKVMHAEGEWHGRATFSPSVLRAIALEPPSQDPITIAYGNGRLLIGAMTVRCEWQDLRKARVQNLLNPSSLDLLALERTLSRIEINATDLGDKIHDAQEKVARSIRRAASALSALEITESQIRELVEARIQSRLGDQRKLSNMPVDEKPDKL